jgi:rhamnogalacturonyl hydrolase YesR
MGAMLAIQRYPWEQGVCAQALYEAGEMELFIAMAHDAVLRQQPDGRLAVINQNIAVTDPAANGEPVLRAYELTGEPLYRAAAEKMLAYLKEKAPRTKEGVLYHNEVSFAEGYSPDQLWVDSCYMAPPFLAAMGEFDDALLQMEGLFGYLQDGETGLLYHNYDVSGARFVRKLLWATGNGWALMGLARLRALAEAAGRNDVEERARAMGKALLKALLPFQRKDGLYHDILDDEGSFVDGSSAMMAAAFIFRGVFEGWLDENCREYAEKSYQTMLGKFDAIGLLHDVCGCPHFVSSGTSAEAQAGFLMMDAWRARLNGEKV